MKFATLGPRGLLARHFLPEQSIGYGIVMVHGGAWTANDRVTPTVMCELLAARGLDVFSLDFRCGPNHRHPAASADIAAGIRFVRSQAPQLGIDPNRIGLIGSSSGGHLALFTGLQPDIPAHRTTTPVLLSPASPVQSAAAISAQVDYIVALWPVSNPLFRYQYAKRKRRSELIEAHVGYFGDEVTMREASVQAVLRDGRASNIPPILIVQPGEDANVPEEMTADLVTALQECDADVTYRYIPGLPHAYAYEASAATTTLADFVWDFIRPQLDGVDDP